VYAADERAWALLAQGVAEVARVVEGRGWPLREVSEMPARRLSRSGFCTLGFNDMRGGIAVFLRDSWTSAVGLVTQDDVVVTLLHELAHFEVGPHDAGFYQLLRALVLELCGRTARAAHLCRYIARTELMGSPSRYRAFCAPVGAARPG